MPDRQPRPGDQHPPEWRRDLNPDPMAGQNVGVASRHTDAETRTAYDLKHVHRRLGDWPDEDLKQIPVLVPGTRLQQGATYVDLDDPERGEFTAMGDMVASEDQSLVPKSNVDYQVWNRLIGVKNPERLGLADEA
jgi:hypothetical protein